MSNSGWVVLGIAAIALYLAFFGNPLGDLGARDAQPNTGAAPAGAQGNQQGLVNDLVAGITAAVTLGSSFLQSNPKTT